MTPDVVQVKPLADYCLEAIFDTGERRCFDMKPYLSYPAFSPLAENSLFMKARVACGTVVWNDEIDLSPDTLYLRGKPLHDGAS
ncbi:MAG: DUF2442 domain-containing protein [Sulfuritalea sp.]|jgi:hypothetical protein|nr:DUF2442 domain-containing protein [Sulfuritalea sp.]